MGAWDVGSFSNDDAMDWVADLSNDPSLDLVCSALSKITSADNLETEGPECWIALAAAEVVAAALGKPIDNFPEELSAWTQENASSLGYNRKSALDAVKLIKNSSEQFKALYREPTDFSKWIAMLDGLIARLSV